MKLKEFIKEHPEINLTISGNELVEFGKWIASTTAEIILTEQREKIYTRKEVINLFSIGETTLWRWEKYGFIKGKRIGRRKFYKKQDIENAMQRDRLTNNKTK